MSSPKRVGDESAFLARLRAGDEATFRQLLKLHHANMIGFARTFTRSRETAEEIVQETWLALIEGLPRFQQRSSLKAYIYAILSNKAKTRATRDSRVKTFSELAILESATDPAVDLARFSSSGNWREPPREWKDMTPEREVSDRQLHALLREGIDQLPSAQRAVVILRDVEGCSAEEACNILGVTETNHRVMLHRGRAKLRSWMEDKLSVSSPKKGCSDA